MEVKEQHGVTEETPEQQVLRREEQRAVQDLLEELPEPYFTAVRLFYYQDYSYQEIAERTGLPLKTVESQLYRARKMLRSKGERLR